MFTSIVVCGLGFVASILYSAFEAEVHAFLVARMATVEEKEVMLPRLLPSGTMDIWENGMECQLHHDYPMYW